MNYHIEATDGGIGHVENLLIDEETWAIRYLVVDTSNWWLGHQVLIAPQWIREVRWFDNTVAVAASQQTIKDAPPHDAAIPLSRDQEFDLYRHHGRAGYWAEEGKRGNREFSVSSPFSQADKAPPGTIERLEDEPDSPGPMSIGWPSRLRTDDHEQRALEQTHGPTHRRFGEKLEL